MWSQGVLSGWGLLRGHGVQIQPQEQMEGTQTPTPTLQIHELLRFLVFWVWVGETGLGRHSAWLQAWRRSVANQYLLKPSVKECY